jgi:RNA polymerase sigma-70 factor (ECF subfamily)
MNLIARFDRLDASGKAEQPIMGVQVRFRRNSGPSLAFGHQPAILGGYDSPKAPVASPKPPTKEQELVAAAGRGDEQAFAALVEPSMGMLYSVVLRILGDPSDAQDALQEALLSIHLDLGKFEGKSKFSTWAYRICVNQALMLRRTRSSRREDPMGSFQAGADDDRGFVDLDLLAAGRQEAEALDLVERLQVKERVLTGLDELSEGQRAVFVLKDLEDWDTEDIARHLGITSNLVRQRLRRARLGLREHMIEFASQVCQGGANGLEGSLQMEGSRP